MLRLSRVQTLRYGMMSRMTMWGQRPGYDAFMATRRFDRLDGMRAVSILLVLTIHSEVAQLSVLRGFVGVQVFFVISGFLITTLLLREEAKHGRIDLGGFYIRRAFRILPLYYLALAITSAAVFVGLGENPGNYGERLAYFLTYTNEFAPDGTFGHSWSLAVEEKFYLVWPALAFLLPFAVKYRGWLGGAILVATATAGLLAPWTYVGMYAPIMAGCVLAVMLNNPRGFRIVVRIANPIIGLLAVALCLAAVWVTVDNHMGVPSGLGVALAFPFLLLGPRLLVGWLGSRVMVWIGQRAYATYLFHPLVGSAVDVAVRSERGLPYQVVHLVLMTLGSVALAQLLFRFFEHPVTEYGRVLAARRSERRNARPNDPSPASLL